MCSMVEELAAQEAKPEPEKKSEPASETSPAAVAAQKQKAKEKAHDLHKLAAKKNRKHVVISRRATAKQAEPSEATDPEPAKPAKAPKVPKLAKVPKGDRDAKLETERRAAILEEFHGKEVKLKEVSHRKWPKELKMAVSTTARVVYRLIEAGKVEVTKRGNKRKQAPKGGILQVKFKGK